MSTGVRAGTLLPDDWPLWAGIVVLELGALAVYVAAAGSVESPRYVIYPFIWINVGLFAVTRVGPVRADRRRRLTAAGMAAGYGLGLAVLTGLVGLPLGEHAHAHPSGLTASLSAPGWGPRIAYVLGAFHLYFVPFRVVGYVALSYLVYARLATLSLASGVGVIGLAACVGCTLPLLAGTLGGAGAAALAAAGGYSLDISTLAFLLAVAGLWQPWQD